MSLLQPYPPTELNPQPPTALGASQQPVLTQLPGTPVTQIPTGTPQPPQMLGQTPPTYQIGPNDTDLSNVADKNGVTLQQLVDANGGQKTLGPVGSYLSLYNESEKNGAPIQSNQYTPPNLGQYPSIGMSALGSMASQYAALPDDVALNTTVASFQSGVLPPSISSYVANNLVNPKTGLKYTPTELANNGYTFNPATGSYTLSSTSQLTQSAGGINPATGQAYTQLEQIASGKGEGFQRVKAGDNYGAFVAQEQAFLNAKRWDPERKKFVKIGQLIKEGRLDVKDRQARLKRSKQQNSGGGQPAQVAAPAGTTESASQNLALNIGSG